MRIYAMVPWAIMVILCTYVTPVFTQISCNHQRTNINDLSDAQQCQLRNLMLDYLNSQIDPNGTGTQKYPIVDMHVNPPVGGFGDFHGNNEHFATWHAAYVQGMEEYFIAQGFLEFVPLPYWTPHTSIPDAFYNYSGCGGTYANLPETEGFPPYSSAGPFDNGSTIDFSDFESVICASFSGVDDFVASMRSPHHNAVHGAVGGTLGPANTAPASTLFWLFHAYITDLHACYERNCEGKTSDLLVRDGLDDNGDEPSPSHPNWTSPDIWLRNNDDGFAENNRVSETLCYKDDQMDGVRPVYVYVRVWNTGETTSS